jgi:hypothetical protein
MATRSSVAGLVAANDDGQASLNAAGVSAAAVSVGEWK